MPTARARRRPVAVAALSLCFGAADASFPLHPRASLRSLDISLPPNEWPAHVECFDVSGQPAGVPLSTGAYAAVVREHQMREANRLNPENLPPISPVCGAASPIPAECFQGEISTNQWCAAAAGGAIGAPPVLARTSQHFSLAACATGRSVNDTLRICLEVCARSDGCVAAALSGPVSTGAQAECVVYGADGSEDFQYPLCAEYPLRFNCIQRAAGGILGIMCPAEPVDRCKYLAPDAQLPALPSPPWQPAAVERLRIGLRLEFNSEADALFSCDSLREDARAFLLSVLADVTDVIVDCPTGREALTLIVWAIFPAAAPVAAAQLRSCLCGPDAFPEDSRPCSSSGAMTMGTPPPSVCEQLSASLVDTHARPNAARAEALALASASKTTWEVEGYSDGLVDDVPRCIDDAGELAGLVIGPNAIAMIFGDNVQLLPEEHAALPEFTLSMTSPHDRFPVPLGCFSDTEADGTVYNPALMRRGQHYELLGEACAGNRTQAELLRICLTICSHVDFGGPGRVDARCIGANFDEHGYGGGHCHLIASSASGSDTDDCRVRRGFDRGGLCAEHPALTQRRQCDEGGVLAGLKECGRENFLGIFCHFSDGSGPNPGRLCIEGTGYDSSKRRCTPCSDGEYSVLVPEEKRDPRVPRPTDYPAAGRICKTCPAGHVCFRGTSCAYRCEPEVCPPLCPRGHECPEGTATPQPCSAGRYQDEEGSSSCKPCPTGYSLSEGSDSVGSCVCPDGYRRTFQNAEALGRETAATCELCDEGMLCDWGAYLSVASKLPRVVQINNATENQTIPYVLPGYWASEDMPMVVLLCDSRRTHPDCVGGAPGGDICANGRRGALCASCGSDEVAISTGGCSDCATGISVGLGVGLGIAVLLALYALHRVCNKPFVTERLTSLGSIGTIGQLLEFTQALVALSQVNVAWQSPFKDVLDALETLIFRFEYIGLPCLISDDPLISLLVRLLAPICLIALFGGVFLVDILLRPSMDQSVDAWVNTVGHALLVMYISLALITFSPLICFQQPDGSYSLEVSPDVACWEGGAHVQMLIVSCIFILIYPVAIYSACAVIVYRYPTAILSDAKFMRRFRFLFGRWDPSRHKYQLLRLARSFLLAAIPTLLPYDAPQIQLSLLTLVLSVSLSVQLALWPWRVRVLNAVDAGLTVVLLLIICIMATSIDEELSDIASHVTFALVCACLVGSLLLVLYMWRAGTGAHRYKFEFFLSHHKGGAGNTARLIKLLLAHCSRGQTFFDADNLASLDSLFDAVRAARRLVIILSDETLERPWCVGEIVVAHLNRVPMVPLVLPFSSEAPRFSAPEESCVATNRILAPFGITPAEIHAALAHLLTQVERHRCSTAAEAVAKVFSSCRFTSPALKDLTPMCDDTESLPLAHYCVLCDGSNFEAKSACLYLKFTLQQMLQEPVGHISSELPPSLLLESLMRQRKALIVLLTPGVLSYPPLAAYLTLAWRFKYPMQPVLVSREFVFPTEDFFTTLAARGAPLADSPENLEDLVNSIMLPPPAVRRSRGGTLGRPPLGGMHPLGSFSWRGVPQQMPTALAANEVVQALREVFRRIAVSIDIPNIPEENIKEQLHSLIGRLLAEPKPEQSVNLGSRINPVASDFIRQLRRRRRNTVSHGVIGTASSRNVGGTSASARTIVRSSSSGSHLGQNHSRLEAVVAAVLERKRQESMQSERERAVEDGFSSGREFELNDTGGPCDTCEQSSAAQMDDGCQQGSS